MTTAFDVCLNGRCQGRPGVLVEGLTHTFRDLEVFTPYEFSVSARTSVGAGPISDPVRARTETGKPNGE